MPLYVFIDVNLPPASVEFEDQRWLGEILDTMMELASKGYTDPCPANAIFFCNDPSHFITDRPLNDVTDHLWIKHFTAEVPRIDHPNSAIVERFMKAYTQRVAGPDAIDFC